MEHNVVYRSVVVHGVVRNSGSRRNHVRTVALLLAWLIAAAATVAGGLKAVQTAQQVEPSAARSDGSSTAPLEPTVPSARFIGSLSCSATACHGLAAVPNVDRQAGHEYVFWLERDPHARAAASLSSPVGLAMLERLGIVRDRQVLDKEGLANCEACHNPRPSQEERMATYPAEGEGVSCEACHGAAEHWRTIHYRRSHGRSELVALGMIDTKDLVTRADLCVGCHVAGRGEVNHDMIAAGHPALKFELSAYHSIYPKHWDEAFERQRWPDRDWRLWCVGQQAAAKAAVNQLLRRAQSQQAPWPELAEWDCYACHHDLNWPSWRQQRGSGSRRPGALPWSQWYVRYVTWSTPAGHRPPLTQAIDDLAAAFEQAALPDRQRVIRHGSVLLQTLRASSGEVPDRMSVVQELQNWLEFQVSASGTLLHSDWDSWAQLYLMLRAWAGVDRGGSSSRDESLKAALNDLRREIAFSPGHNSPRTFDRLAGSSAVQREQAMRQLRQTVHLLKEVGAH